MAQRRDLLSQIGANKRRNVYLLVGFAVLITGAWPSICSSGSGAAFIVVAFVIAIGLVWASYFYSDRLPVLGDAS